MQNGNANNAPDDQKAAKMALYYKICAVIGFVFLMGFMIVGGLYVKDMIAAPVLWLSLIPVGTMVLLGTHFKRQEMKLRCTIRVTAFCVETVRRRSVAGMSYNYHPVVEFEADGEKRTAELASTCTQDAVGETYVIYYDPLDPSVVREEEHTEKE